MYHGDQTMDSHLPGSSWSNQGKIYGEFPSSHEDLAMYHHLYEHWSRDNPSHAHLWHLSLSLGMGVVHIKQRGSQVRLL